MFRYTIKVDYLTKMVFIEDNREKTLHMFTRDRISAEHGIPLRHKKYPLDGNMTITVPTYRTNMDIFGEGCENYIYDFNAFTSILKEALG